MPGILMSRIARSGFSSRTSSIAWSPRPVSPDDVVALFLEDLLEVEPDDRLVLGEHDAHGLMGSGSCGALQLGHGGRRSGRRGRASAAMRSSRSSCSRSSSAIERRSESRWRACASAWRRTSCASASASGRLRHERPQAGVFGLGLEERALLLGDGQLGAQPLEPVAHVDQAALEQGRGTWVRQSTTQRRPVWQREHQWAIAPRDLHRPSTTSCGQSVRRFVDAEVRPYVDEWEAAGRFPDDVFRRCGELGFLGLHYPRALGRQRRRPRRRDRLRRGARPLWRGAIPMAISVQIRHGDARARASSAPTTSGSAGCGPRSPATKIGAIAITEPDAGSDVAAIRTRAVRDGDAWRVNGRRCSSPTATRADFLTLVAQTEPGCGHRGISLFVVDTTLPGVSVSRTARQARDVVERYRGDRARRRRRARTAT